MPCRGVRTECDHVFHCLFRSSKSSMYLHTALNTGARGQTFDAAYHDPILCSEKLSIHTNKQTKTKQNKAVLSMIHVNASCVREINKNNLLGGKFSIFFLPKFRENNYLGGQPSIFERSNTNNVFFLRKLRDISIFQLPSSANTQCRI